jgi:hypothetical protein
MPALGKIKNNGDVVSRRRRVRTPSGLDRNAVAESFWAKVPDRPEDPAVCWEWRGDRMAERKNGTVVRRHTYGLFRKLAAHRVSVWLATGEDPGNLFVLHSCDSPPCVRPSHLRMGTHLENMADKVSRGRCVTTGKLRRAQVIEMRLRHATGETALSLAPQFDISVAQAQRIVNGTSWRPDDAADLPLPEWRRRGFRGPFQRLADRHVEEIRRRYAEGGISQRRLGKEYGVGQPHISYIVRGIERRAA